MELARTAVVVIDVQNGILAGVSGDRGHETVYALDATVGRIAGLLDRARAAGTPVFYVQHDGGPGSPLQPHTPAWEIRAEIAPKPGEPVIRKRACDAFFETALHTDLAALHVTRIVVAGCMTQYCVDTSVRRAVTLGYDVVLAADGHATADAGGLRFEQIIAHHNNVLDGFDAGSHVVDVSPISGIQL
jgi:nicotinamidase-related amidase